MSDPNPTLFGHIKTVYDKMLSQADKSTTEPIWDGYTTELLKECELSSNYYTPIFKFLKVGGYIEQLRRGGGGSTSQYVLLKEPLVEEFLRVLAKSGAGRSNSQKALTTTIELQGKVLDLEEKVDAIAKAMVEVQRMVMRLSNNSQGDN